MRRPTFLSIEDAEKEERARAKRRQIDVVNECLWCVLLVIAAVYFGLQVARELVEEIREVLLLLGHLIGV